jgi:hypothetical protein
MASFYEGWPPPKVHLGSNGLVEHNFNLFWNGRIEGHVKDDSGKPAHAWLMVQNTDGSTLLGYVPVLTDQAGFYQLQRIPPGRYIVVVNPDGPHDDWPHNVQYYPFALQAKGAQVLELGEGQRIQRIDFTVPRLAERTVHVRVTWPNGSAAAGAHVCVAYEQTGGYASLESANCIKDTDQSGVAVIRVYGNSRLRLFAKEFVSNDKEDRVDAYYSRAEYEAGTIPEKLDLVLNSLKP